MYIGVRGGHSKAAPGASYFLNELNENRIIYPIVINELVKVGNKVANLTPPENYPYPEELNYGINKANILGIELGVSIHFNAAGVTDAPMGVECWVVDNPDTPTRNRANAICKNLSNLLGIPNRGLKFSPSQGFLAEIMNTNMPWIIVEVCFVSSRADAEAYKRTDKNMVARAIANGIDSRVKLETGEGPIVSEKKFKIDMFAHIQNIGNVSESGFNSLMIGTTGKGLRLEGFAVKVQDFSFKLLVHQANRGDVVVRQGDLVGSISMANALEGIEFLDVKNYSGYKLEYRVHMANKGWSSWVVKGFCGSRGESRALEAIEVRIVKL